MMRFLEAVVQIKNCATAAGGRKQTATNGRGFTE
jgi:hypothetical protein